MPLDQTASVPPVPHAHVVFTDLDGAEGVLVDLDTKQYFQLNATASFIWRGLTQGTAATDIARGMTEAFEVSLEDAQASVDAAIHDFISYRLVAPR